MSEQKDLMLRGEIFCWDDPELEAGRLRGARLLERYNSTPRAEVAAREAILKDLFGHLGERVNIVAPVYCEYGDQISVEDDVFMNVNVMLLDVGRIVVKRWAMLGPGVQLLTATHPIEAQGRIDKLEQGKPITIGEAAWLGGGVIVLPGVTIGDRTTVGAGSVVTKDLPPDVLALGNPARVIRSL